MGRVFFATNRAWKDDAFGIVASDGNALRLGVADVPSAGTGFPLNGCSFTCDGDDDFVSADGTCGAIVKQYLHDAATAGLTPLVSIHGFQYTFEEAVIRTSELADWFAGAPDPVRTLPFLVTWPSSGLLGGNAYATDRQSAKEAGGAVARLFSELASRGASGRAILLVHSSGAWALEHAVRAAAATGKVPENLFRHAVLAAADVAADSLEPGGGLHALARMAEEVTVVVYRGDVVLDPISKLYKMNGARLGSDGPRLDQPLPPNVRVIDVSYLVDLSNGGPVTGGDADFNLIHHQYYRRDPGVRAAIAALLAGRQPAGWRRGVANQPIAVKEREADFYWYAGAGMVQPPLDPTVNAGG